MKRYPSVVAAVLFSLATPAFAGGEHRHTSKHGGVVVESGHHHFEVVLRDGVLEVYVEEGEDRQPENVTGATAKATILSLGQKEEIVLNPGLANSFKGSGAFKAVKGATVVITVTMPGHIPEQARIRLD